jgi:hypothetical protein
VDISWQAIVTSEAWEYHIEPWLKELHTDCLLDLSECDLKDVRFRQGYAKAIQDVLNIPNEMIEAERMEREEENKENGRRDIERRDWLRTIRRAI